MKKMPRPSIVVWSTLLKLVLITAPSADSSIVMLVAPAAVRSTKNGEISKKPRSVSTSEPATTETVPNGVVAVPVALEINSPASQTSEPPVLPAKGIAAEPIMRAVRMTWYAAKRTFSWVSASSVSTTDIRDEVSRRLRRPIMTIASRAITTSNSSRVKPLEFIRIAVTPGS